MKPQPVPLPSNEPESDIELLAFIELVDAWRQLIGHRYPTSHHSGAPSTPSWVVPGRYTQTIFPQF